METNERHLQQMAIEEGVSTRPPMSSLRENYGFNDIARNALQGTYEFEEDITEEVAEQTLRRNAPILGTISSTEIQAMFKMKKERTSSDTRTLNYSLDGPLQEQLSILCVEHND